MSDHEEKLEALGRLVERYAAIAATLPPYPQKGCEVTQELRRGGREAATHLGFARQSGVREFSVRYARRCVAYLQMEMVPEQKKPEELRALGREAEILFEPLWAAPAEGMIFW